MTKANGLEVSKVSPGLYWMESVMVSVSECRHEDDQVSAHPMMMTPLCPRSEEAVITLRLRPAECQA